MKFDLKPMMNSTKLLFKKYSPEIFTFLGIGGMVGGTVMACKATLKLEPVLSEHKEKAAAVHQKYPKDENAQKQELTKVYAKTAGEVVKLYAPSVIIGVLSITGILTGNNILKERNVALAAAYAAVDSGFKKYRGRVVDRFGTEVDKELRAASHGEQMIVTETDEDGKKKKVKKTINVVDSTMPSDFARYFSYGDTLAAEPNAEYNEFFLKAQQERANLLLQANGYLFLNDVYAMLGYEKTKAGQAVGWVYDRNSEDHGDNYVDFGIQEVYRKRSDEPGDYEKLFLLDFNVDGSIMEHVLNKGMMATI